MKNLFRIKQCGIGHHREKQRRKLIGISTFILLFVVALVSSSLIEVDISNIQTADFGGGIAGILALASLVGTSKFKEFSADEVESMTKEEFAEYSKLLRKHREKKEIDLANQIVELQKNATENKEQIDKLTKELNGITIDDFRNVLKAVDAQGKQLTKMLEEGKISDSKFESSLKKIWDENYKHIEESHKSRGVHSIVVKAEATYGDITNGSDYAQMRDGVFDKPIRKPKFRSLFRTIPVTTEFYKYAEQDTVIRNAQNVAKCVAVVSNTKETIVVRSIETKVIKDEIDFCRMYIEDYPFMESRIRTLIDESLMLRVDEQILLGTGLLEETFSIDSVSSEFSAANPVAVLTNSIKDANYIDLIIGMETQISELGEQDGYVPDTVLVNKVDWFKLVQSKKDANNNYLDYRVVTVDGTPFINGMRVIWSPKVAQNTVYVFDSTKAEIVDRNEVTIDVSFENNDNFSKQLGTLMGYVRLNFLVANNNKNAFMKSSDVALAITAITAP